MIRRYKRLSHASPGYHKCTLWIISDKWHQSLGKGKMWLYIELRVSYLLKYADIIDGTITMVESNAIKNGLDSCYLPSKSKIIIITTTIQFKYH